MAIEVADYDPLWPEQFESLRRLYAGALAAAGVPVMSIEHVGSTAVPGLAAKPVIDCDIVVEELDVAAASSVLVSLGFEPLGELGIPQRWAFRPPATLGWTATYVVVRDCLSLRNHLSVRDTLRGDAALRNEYSRVKRSVRASAADIFEYGRGKNSVVQKILESAGLSEADRASINANQVPGPEVAR